MLEQYVLFVGGLALLVVGAERAVSSAGDLALYYGVSKLFVGVTVIAVGTSVPEMTTSLYAASYGAGDLLVGNIVGSETAQITLAIGIVALISPIFAERRNVMIYGGAMVLSMIIMILTIEDGELIRSEGFLMMLSYVFFIYTMYTNEGGEEITEEVVEREPPRRTVPWIVLGLGMVVLGGHVMVTSGVEIARSVGISEYVVGLLTGLGTTAPEIVVAGIAARGGEEGISVGAILGSNITDPVFSLGIGPLFYDVTLDDPGGIMSSAEYMLLVSLLVLGLFYWQRGIDRRAAVLCMLLYPPSFFLT
ncbi:sodium:calcium antiporter [Haloarchaeobius litoreus]|uniref:Sodium:calcium antiporter n=1 Tax=Haloarchaeobius litoreus TaxID=755306 RepID=A0ABD6DQC2_9EURY